ncbi:uncharacterized protein LOC126676753 [Mercurialis annua]|uniref:uncharacterized protein LOC126676753 n=1 Tax=Mercurialis annua TaxID=3986 RepID=UPI0021605A64|nr:uncharacterized protein LOC126676753 [Mercurialis annua]
MARPLFFTSKPQNLPFLPLISIFLTAITIFSILSFLCTSHRKTKKSQESNDQQNSSCSNSSSSQFSSERKLFSKLNSKISSKAVLMVKMVSWKKNNQHDGYDAVAVVDDDDDSEEGVWRKSIMMGERCRPLDFSGKIEYDCEGNRLDHVHVLVQSGHFFV